MKIIPVLILLMPLYMVGQECSVKKTTDPYTRETKFSSGLISLQGTSLAIYGSKQEIDFFFSMDAREKCFTDASTAVVFFEGTKMRANFKNGGSMNCDGVFHIIFRNGELTPTLLKRLTTQKITSIVFTESNKSTTTITLSPEEQEKVMTLGDCVVKEAKTLL